MVISGGYKIYINRGEKMTIEVLVCRPDGTQVMERREVADDWFAVPDKTTEETTNE